MHGISTEDHETGARTAAEARARNRLEAWLVIAFGIGGAALLARDRVYLHIGIGSACCPGALECVLRLRLAEQSPVPGEQSARGRLQATAVP